MKYWEFDKYEYTAIICANTEEEAIVEYEYTVADIEDNEKELHPTEISEEIAKGMYVRYSLEYDVVKAMKEFDYVVSKGVPVSLLIDRTLA